MSKLILPGDRRFQFPYELGTDLVTGARFAMDPRAFLTHLHLIGATGTGKTTLMEVILRLLFVLHNPSASFFIVDPFGGFATRLLRFIASRRLCPSSVRGRLVYFEPANTDYTTILDPLRHDTREEQDYQVARAMDLLLRGSESQDVSAMPRLRRFLHQALLDISTAGLPLGAVAWLLAPGSAEHNAILNRLSPASQLLWRDLLEKHGNKAMEYLDSTRNRVSLFSDYQLLRRMFSAPENSFDVPRFIREGKIVIVNLTPGSKKTLHWHVAKTIGAMIINEVFNEGVAAMAQDGKPSDIFLAIDEFQRYLGPDIFEFLPVVRQMGIRLILAHQSFSQLIQGDLDLRPMIAQARTRGLFANDFLDADILAEEIAAMTWDPNEIKHQQISFRQRQVGHEIRRLLGGNRSSTHTRTATRQNQEGSSSGLTEHPDSESHSSGRNRSQTNVEGLSDGSSVTESWSESLTPVLEDFYETVGVQFVQKDECRQEWRQVISQQQQGQCLFKQVNDPALHPLQVDYLPISEDSRSDDELAQLLQQNYAQPCFLSSAAADQKIEQLKRALLGGGPPQQLPNHRVAEPRDDYTKTFDD